MAGQNIVERITSDKVSGTSAAEGRTLYPWDLTLVPNFDSSRTVQTEDVDNLEEERFHRQYVLRNRPCLIKCAVEQWPAFRRWRNSEYVISRIGSVKVRASISPKLEAFGLRSAESDAIAAKTTIDRMLPAETVRKLLPELQRNNDDVLFIELRPSDEALVCLGEDLLTNGRRFSFLRFPPSPRFSRQLRQRNHNSLLRSGWAVMFYKNSYSDWHFHPGTEAIMCQLLGTKDVLLLPPNRDSWETIVPIHVQQSTVYKVDTAKFPKYSKILPYHVVVEPGDGLFIPINWWHAVQGRFCEYGITVPITWNGPYYDLRQPASQYFLRALWKTRKGLAATVLLESVWRTIGIKLRELENHP